MSKPIDPDTIINDPKYDAPFQAALAARVAYLDSLLTEQVIQARTALKGGSKDNYTKARDSVQATSDELALLKLP